MDLLNTKIRDLPPEYVDITPKQLFEKLNLAVEPKDVGVEQAEEPKRKRKRGE